MARAPAPVRAAAALSVTLSMALAVSIAAGCATPPSPRPVAGAAARSPPPLKMTGRFSMTHTETVPEDKRDGASGRFELFKAASRPDRQPVSPFGQTIARAEHRVGTPATLQTQDGRVFTGATLDEVFERAIGIRVPAEQAARLARRPLREVVERSPDGRRIRARDGGWDIDRSGDRWDLVWHEGTQRIEVRLLPMSTRAAPPAPQPGAVPAETASLTLSAPAKLNLFLHVTGRRADGYHLLETVFQFIDLADTHRLAVRDDGRDSKARVRWTISRRTST